MRAIARELGCSRNTVRRHLREARAARYGPGASRVCKLDPYKACVLERVHAAKPHWILATVLLREIAERGYAGGISQHESFVAPPKRCEPEPLVRFETPPGRQMQADFTAVRRGRDTLLALVATLGCSRASFAEYTADETTPALCRALRAAFGDFGGLPAEVLLDNAKSVVPERDAHGPGLHRPRRSKPVATRTPTWRWRASGQGWGGCAGGSRQRPSRRRPCRCAV